MEKTDEFYYSFPVGMLPKKRTHFKSKIMTIFRQQTTTTKIKVMKGLCMEKNYMESLDSLCVHHIVLSQ